MDMESLNWIGGTAIQDGWESEFIFIFGRLFAWSFDMGVDDGHF